MSNEHRLRAIGAFYEELAQHLLGGARHEDVNTSDGPDIEHYEWDVTFEVKASDNGHFFKVFDRQLRRYLEGRGFPFLSRCWYVLFAYRRGRPNLDRHVSGQDGLARYLMSNTTAVYIIDAEVIAAIGRRNGTSMMLKKGTQESVIRLTRGLLNQIIKDPAMLEGFGFSRGEFRIESDRVTTEFRQQRLELSVYYIVPLKLPKKITRTLFELGVRGDLQPFS